MGCAAPHDDPASQTRKHGELGQPRRRAETHARDWRNRPFPRLIVVAIQDLSTRRAPHRSLLLFLHASLFFFESYCLSNH
jgi:hypothetical protein